MKKIYVLDACSLLAILNIERGSDIVEKVLREAFYGNADVYMNKINLYEVYYGIYRACGKQKADEAHSLIKKQSVKITETFSDEIFTEAARFKSQYKMSLADSIALGEAVVRNAGLLTADHHEFDMIEKHENIKFHWIR